MIRPALPGDTPKLIHITEGTGVFRPTELEALREVLDEYHGGAHAEGHRCVVLERSGQIAGYAYYAPTAMTDRGWHLWWIAVNKEVHARGIGSELLRYLEDDIRQANGRQLLIETSSLPHYELTRKFYLKHGYEQACVQPDYYADGDHMVIFRKRFH